MTRILDSIPARLTAVAMVAVLQAAATSVAQAQTFPQKPVRMIVAFPPGGGTDIVARVVSQRLSETLGQQVVVDNRGGAAGIIGTDIAAKAPPDGHTLFMGTMGNIAVNPVLYAKLPFDLLRDLSPVTQVVAVDFLVYAHPSLPVKTVKELIALARARPGQIPYGHSGNGGAPHLGGALFESMAGVKLVSVPYKGSGPAFADLLGGHVTLSFDSGLQGLPHVRSGKLRALAVLGTRPSPLLPGVPVMADTLPGYELTNWYGLVTPVATPRELVTRWHAEVAKVLAQPDIREKLAAQGANPVGSTPEAFGTFIRAEMAKWSKVIRESKISAD